jgi:hypothetical protein
MKSRHLEKNRSTGIHPLNPDIFTDEDFIIHNQPSAEPATISDRPSEIPCQSSTQPTTTSNGSTYSIHQSSKSLGNMHILAPSNTFRNMLEKNSPPPKITSARKTSRTKQHSEILTASPMKNVYEIKKTKKFGNRSPRKNGTEEVDNRQTNSKEVRSNGY